MDALDLGKAAADFVAETEGTPERRKKTLFDTSTFEIFLLYIKGKGHVPAHQAKGEITVQTLLGKVRMAVEGSEYAMPVGRILPVDSNVTHELWADEDSVCLVTMAKAQ